MRTKPNLKTWLKKKGYTYEVFAQKLGFTKQRLEQIIKGDVELKLETAFKIWRATKYEVALVSLKPSLKRMLPKIKEMG